jgi:hypothetical protein
MHTILKCGRGERKEPLRGGRDGRKSREWILKILKILKN